MKNCKPLMLMSILPLLLASCGQDEGIIIWHNFGGSYTQVFNDVVDVIKEDMGVNMTPKSKKSYDGVLDEINKSIATSSYPDIATGYPDHFAGYIKDDIMLELTPYFEMYNEKYGVDLEADFYPQYMRENKELREGKIYGIPFNKSTEVMVYNTDLFKFIQSVDPTVVKVPETWDEFAVEGPKYIQVLKDAEVFKVEDASGATIRTGKGLAVKYNENGPAEYKKYEKGEKGLFNIDEGFQIIADFSDCKENNFNVLMWDSQDNLFITAMRQWGSSYTGLTKAEEQSRGKKGHLEFWNTVNPDYAQYKEHTKAALRDLYNLYDIEDYESHVFNVTTNLFNSDAFKNGTVLFNVGSSGGLSNNLPKGVKDVKMSTPLFDVGIVAVPYKYADKKFVISQGANLGVFDHQRSVEDNFTCFEIAAKLATGDYQGYFAATTGYFPASKSATASEPYQEYLISEKTGEKLLYLRANILNEQTYMVEELGWDKFVDKAFVGSSNIRTGVKEIILKLFNRKADIHAGKITLDAAIEKVLNDAVAQLADYNKQEYL